MKKAVLETFLKFKGKKVTLGTAKDLSAELKELGIGGTKDSRDFLALCVLASGTRSRLWEEVCDKLAKGEHD